MMAILAKANTQAPEVHGKFALKQQKVVTGFCQ